MPRENSRILCNLTSDQAGSTCGDDARFCTLQSPVSQTSIAVGPRYFYPNENSI